jgi:peptidoglycan/LPS O-acetylase OafA/YrhL
VTAHRIWRLIGLVLLVALLLACVYNGLVEGWNELQNDDTPPMRVATATQLLYGAAALGALIALAIPNQRRWVYPLLVVWGVACTITATLAPVVYGEASWNTGAAAGLLTVLIVLLVLWGWRRACKRPDPPGRPDPLIP